MLQVNYSSLLPSIHQKVNNNNAFANNNNNENKLNAKIKDENAMILEK